MQLTKRKRLLFVGVLFPLIFQAYGNTLAFTLRPQVLTMNFDCLSVEVTGESLTQGSWSGCRLKGCIGNKSYSGYRDAFFRFEAYGRRGKLWEEEIEIPFIGGKQEYCFNTSVPCYDFISNVKIKYLGTRGTQECCSRRGGVDYCDEMTKRFKCKDGTYSPGYEVGKADSADAKYNLGNAYKDGRGVAQDYVLAHMWFNLAAGEGIKDADIARQEVEKKMTSAQIAEAQELARYWNPYKAACVCE